MAVFCNHDAPNGENYVKSCSKQCQVHKKKSREIAALNYVTFGKLLIIIPAFCVFMGMTFSFSGCSNSADIPRFGKILKPMPNCVR